MYRFKYNTTLAAWQVQLLCYGIIWRNVKTARFSDLIAARHFTDTTGISHHYREQKPFDHKPGVEVAA
jgi:hypothetical protein